MKRILVHILLLMCAAMIAQEFPRAQWIHYPEPDSTGIHKDRYFWTEVEFPEDLSSAAVHFQLDDYGELIVDGKQIGGAQIKYSTCGSKISSRYCDDLTVLTPGRHRIGFRNQNGAGKGGVLARIVFTTKAGETTEVFSGTDWQCALTPCAQGGAASAVSPEVHGDLTCLPFFPNFDVEYIFAQAEQQLHQDAKDARDRRFREFKESVLDQEETPVSSVVYENGLPWIQIGEEKFPPILYSVHHYQNFSYDKYVRSAENFRDGDIHLYVMGVSLKQLWRGPKQYSFDIIDTWAPDAFLHDPDAHILFEIACTRLPDWWMNAHPEECVQYLAKEGSPSHTDPLYQKYIAPSFASELYKSELKEFLEALVKHVEAQPWGKRVFGYRNDNGVYLEWHHWGMDHSIPDVSAPMQHHFTEFLRERYGTDEALQTAWNDPAVTIETARLANLEERITAHAGDLMDPVQDARALDSVRCVIDAIGDFLLETNHVIKEASSRRCLVGNFYGYFFGMSFSAVGWQLQLNRMLNSPDVDFNSQPPVYGGNFRSFGEGQLSRGLVTSHRLHGKLNLMEADTRTNDVPYGTNHCHVQNATETVQLLARDFCQALCTGIGFWYFDFGEGWYTAPEVREYLAKLRPIWENGAVDNSSAAEVLLIGDMESIYNQSNDDTGNTIRTFIDNNRLELSHTGVPFDSILLQDLECTNLRQDYKVYIFLNDILCNPARVEAAERLRAQGKTIVWLDKAGYLCEKSGANSDGTHRLTGFQVECEDTDFEPELLGDDSVRRVGNFHTPSSAKPLMAIRDVDAEVLGTTAGFATYARKRNSAGGWSYLATCPFLKSRDYRKILHEAGVHVYCEDEDVAIYANRSYLMLHTDKGGDRHLSLPRACRLVQLLPEECVLAENAREFCLKADAKTTYLFRME